MNKPRSAILAGIANIIAPSLGHIYLGLPQRGILILFAGLLMMVVMGWAGAATSLWSFYLMQAAYLFIILILIVDGVIQAKKHKNYTLKRYNRWYFYVLFFILLLVFMNVLMGQRSLVFGFDNYRSVSGNMLPTLKVNELIVSDSRGQLLGFKLKRGQIIAFVPPENSKTVFLKRIIAVGGERLKIQDGIVYINDKALAEDYVLATSKQQTFSQNMPEMTVPANSLFVMGDNRDNSRDSRFWGVLPKANVRGIVTTIWYSPEPNRIGTIPY